MFELCSFRIINIMLNMTVMLTLIVGISWRNAYRNTIKSAGLTNTHIAYADPIGEEATGAASDRLGFIR
mgnify:CR=1 FL=1